MIMLEDIARSSGHRFGMIDKLYMALAWGYGHGACHTIFFFLSFLPLTSGNGTFYISTCPDVRSWPAWQWQEGGPSM